MATSGIANIWGSPNHQAQMLLCRRCKHTQVSPSVCKILGETMLIERSFKNFLSFA